MKKENSDSYPGGKNGSGVYQTIINLMPPHRVYMELFLGAGSIMRHKKPAKINIGVDMDEMAVQSFASRTVKNDGAGSESFTIKNDDAFRILREYDFKGDEFVYLDPPYLHETRTKKNLYNHELSDEDHMTLLELIKDLPCMVMISGYGSKLYSSMLSDWNTTTFQAMTRGGKPATEWLWYNYKEPIALHDYSYLGDNYRERERIKRKKERWINKLENMPLLERRALLQAMKRAWAADNVNFDDVRI